MSGLLVQHLPTADTITPTGTLVLLHGYGANAADLLGLRDVIAPTWTALALQAPIDLGPMGMPGGHAWFHIMPSPEGGLSYDTDGAMAAAALLGQAIPEAVEQAGGTLTTTVVLGFSQGAMLGHAMLLHEHLDLRGLAGCSGRMVPELFGDGSRVPEHFPVFLSHGTQDDLIPVESGRAIRDFYSTRTAADVSWTEEPVGHGIGPATLEALATWCTARS